MTSDLSDQSAPQADLKDRLRIMQNVAQYRDPSEHPGSGVESVQIGPDADGTGHGSTSVGRDSTATGDSSAAYGEDAYAFGLQGTAIGNAAYAGGDQSTALGHRAIADHDRSTAIGRDAATSGSDQIMLGLASDTVVVPGTFSNPSARRLKRRIVSAPVLVSIFPDLVEAEYIADPGRRRLTYIADDLLGSDAARFVTFDDDGQPAGIAYLDLVVAQVAVLNARVSELEKPWWRRVWDRLRGNRG